MSNIPDFVMQIQEVQRQLEAQCEVTAEDWKDAVKDRFYDKFISVYSKKLELYIQGGGAFDMSGKGMNDLLIFIDEQIQKMETLTGIPAYITFMRAAGRSYSGTLNDNYGVVRPVESYEEVQYREGVVHNERHERDYWNEEDIPADWEREMRPGHGTRPGQYSTDELKQIMELRSLDDDEKGFDY